jgi:hypothetical protein
LLLQALPATIKTVCIVFVVPADRAESYSNAQKVPNAVTIGRGVTIKQYRLVFPDHDIEAVAVQGPQSPHDEGEGKGKGKDEDEGEDKDKGEDEGEGESEGEEDDAGDIAMSGL